MNKNFKISREKEGSLDSITEIDAKLKDKVEKIRENSAERIAEAKMKAAERVKKIKEDVVKQCREELEIRKTQLEKELEKRKKEEDEIKSSIQISKDRKNKIANEIIKKVIGS